MSDTAINVRRDPLRSVIAAAREYAMHHMPSANYWPIAVLAACNELEAALIASQPKPARWVVEIEDVLRPWEKIKPLGPFKDGMEALSGAQEWAQAKYVQTEGRLNWHRLCEERAILLKDSLGATHYRLTWREETEADR